MRRSLLLVPIAVSLLAACDDKATTPTSPAPAAPVAPAPTPVPPPAPRPAPTQPVSLGVKLNPAPPRGDAPFTLHVSLCASRPVPPVDDYPLTFTLVWGDDGRRHTRYFCRDDHTYETPGIYQATFCAADGIAGHESCASFRVRVD